MLSQGVKYRELLGAKMAVVDVEQGDDLFVYCEVVLLDQVVEFLLQHGLLVEDAHDHIRRDDVRRDLGQKFVCYV